jgi:threonine synthase
MWKAWEELEALGFIGPARPRLVSVQVEGCAPIVRAFEAGERFAAPWENAQTAAAGLRVPGAIGDFLMLDAIRASDGVAVAVPEADLAPMQKQVTATTGLYVGLESAAAAAAIPLLLATGRLDGKDRVVLFDTGSGLKST